MKFSCADFTFPLLSHSKVLQLIKLLDFDTVDLGIFENRSHLYPSFIAENSVKEGKRLNRELEELDLKAGDVFFQPGEDPPINSTNSTEEPVLKTNREWFLKILKFAGILNCFHVTGLPGIRHEKVSFEEDWERACIETQWRIKKAKEQNIIYSVEAHVGSILPDAKATLQFIEDCPGLTLTLDYGHFIYQGQSNESVHSLIPYASHFHARGGAKGKLQTIVKENEIDYKTIISLFKETNYSGNICMEYVYQDWEGCNRTDNVSEMILLQRLLEQLLD